MTEIDSEQSLLIEGLSIKNLTYDNDFRHPLLKIISFTPSLFTVNTVIFYDSIINNAESILFFDNPEGEINLDSILFQNISVGDSTSFLKVNQVQILTSNFLTFLDWNQIEPNDASNLLLNLGDISSQVDGNITFNHLSVRNTTISVLKISNTLESRDIVQNLTFNDIEIRDTKYQYSTHIIMTENIKSNNSFKMIFNRMVIENLYFERASQVLQMNHQWKQALEINDSIINNVTYGAIVIQEIDSTYEVKPSVKISNLTATNNDVNYW